MARCYTLQLGFSWLRFSRWPTDAGANTKARTLERVRLEDCKRYCLWNFLSDHDQALFGGEEGGAGDERHFRV